MKKIYVLWALLLTMMAGTTFTSCDWDDDDAIAYTLEGTWKGNMYVNTYYNGNTYYATATEITFLRDPYRYSSGDGYWVDYYSRAPWDYVANHIRWTVNYGRIRVYFIEEGSELEIYNYRLTDNRFTGYISEYDNDVEFSLYHVSSPNWSNYRWGYDAWYDDYYWSRETRGLAADKPVRRIGK